MSKRPYIKPSYNRPEPNEFKTVWLPLFWLPYLAAVGLMILLTTLL